MEGPPDPVSHLVAGVNDLFDHVLENGRWEHSWNRYK